MCALFFKPGEKVVFIGDSITDCGRRGDVHGPYGNGYVSMVRDFIIARYSGLALGFENRGIGGNTIRDLKARWQQDVIDERPDVLSVKIGINDVWRAVNERHDEAVPLDEFEATFRELASWNLEVIQAAGAKTVLFSCPEGYSTFKDYYPQYFGELPFEVVHLTELLAREIPNAGLVLRPSSAGAVTYQDPCRLGRWAGIYEPPRQLLNLVPETKLIEMERNRENALCCVTTAWMECSSCSKAIQIERLMEAQQTGAKELITACPKCQIHLTCAQSGENMDIQVKDIYTYLAERLDRD